VRIGRPGFARVALLAVALAALAGCEVLLPQQGLAPPSSTCDRIVAGACREQAAVVAGRHSGATNVDLACTAPVCDRRGGTGTAVVRLADGSTVNDTFAYVGDPAPMPAPSCVGLAPDLCRRIAEEWVNDVSPSKRVIAVSVACPAAPCTVDKGQVEITVTLRDGSTEGGGMGWEGGLP
jgi:hypothetical protein